jgi:hypothetical protein
VLRGHRRRWSRSVHTNCMGCGIEPRKVRYRRGREFLFARRQHVRHRYARCCRPAGVEGHITCKRIASEAGRSRVWPSASRERTMESKCLSAFRGAIVHPVTFPRGPPSSQACQRPSVGADLGWNRLLSGEYRLRSCYMTRAIRTHRTGRPEVLVKAAGSTVLLA